MAPSYLCPLLLLAASCGAEPAAQVAPGEERERPAAQAPVPPGLSRTLEAWIAKDWPSLGSAREQKCDDGEWHDLPAEARTLALVVRDARFEKKQLLPLGLTGALTAPKLHALHDALALLPPGKAPSAELSDEVTSLQQRRFAGVFHVTEHYAAERVFRTDRGRWEWMPGTLVAWLAIHDAASGALRCQTLILVKNDTRAAPLAARLKSDTRERLTRELGHEVRREAARALRRITAVLDLPASQS